MNIQELPNGNLKFTANNRDRAKLAERYRDPGPCGGYLAAELYVHEAVRDTGADPVPEFYYEYLGALTSAPIFVDYFVIKDNGEPSFGEKCWWFPNYMVTDPWRELANTGKVVFHSAENS